MTGKRRGRPLSVSHQEVEDHAYKLFVSARDRGSEPSVHAIVRETIDLLYYFGGPVDDGSPAPYSGRPEDLVKPSSAKTADEKRFKRAMAKWEGGPSDPDNPPPRPVAILSSRDTLVEQIARRLRERIERDG